MSVDAPSPQAPLPASLTRVEGHPHLRGFTGLTRAELLRWFPIRVLVFAAAGVAVLALSWGMWSADENAKLSLFLSIFFTLWIAVLVLSTVATTQGAVSSEVQEGTAAWLVAKPIGRPAFVLSKFAGAVPAVFIGMVGVPGMIARVVLEQAAERGDTDFSAAEVFEVITNSSSRDEFVRLPDLSTYLGLLTLIATLSLFLVAVMILLGCVVRRQTGVFALGLAVPIGLFVLGQLAPSEISELTPGSLLASIVDIIGDNPAPVLAPIVVTGVWVGATLTGAVWLFSRREL